MTFESLHIAEITPLVEPDSNEILIAKRIDASREIGELSLKLVQANLAYNAKIIEVIQLNQQLSERGVDKNALARQIQMQLPYEESSLFSGTQPYSREFEHDEGTHLKSVANF